jgi:acyl carrier protein
MTSIQRTLRDFIRDNFYIPEGQQIDESASLRGLGIVDSTGVLEVILFLEKTFGIVVDDSEMLPENLDSLQALTSFVSRKLSHARVEA